MKGNLRRATRAFVAACAIGATLPAHAMLPVIDIPNLVVNIGSKLLLMKISHQLEDQSSGTVNYNTWWTQEYTRNVYDLDVQNTNIDASFVWIINHFEGGGEIIPIPPALKSKVGEIWKGQSADAFSSHYKTFDEYTLDTTQSYRYADYVSKEAARARRSANAALVHAVASQETEIEGEAAGMKLLAEKAKQAEGRNAQLQVANAIAASEVNQFMKMRSLMMVAEAQRAAESQARADKDVRAMVVGDRMRQGLTDAAKQLKQPAVVY